MQRCFLAVVYTSWLALLSPVPAAGLARDVGGLVQGASVAASRGAEVEEEEKNCTGALGDGETDDGPAIQACLRELRSFKLRAGALYCLHTDLVVGGGPESRILGEGTRIRCMMPFLGVVINAGASLLLQGVSLEYCGQAQGFSTPTKPAILASGSLTLDLEASIKNSRYTAVESISESNQAITLRRGSSIVDSAESGIDLRFGYLSSVVLDSFSWISGSRSGHGIQVLASSNVSVVIRDQSWITDCASNGIYVSGGAATHISLDDAVIRGCGRRGIHVTGGELHKVELFNQSIISSSGGTGVEAWHCNRTLVRVEGATIQHSGHSAVVMGGRLEGNVLAVSDTWIYGGSRGVVAEEVAEVRLQDVVVKETDGVAVRVIGKYLHAENLQIMQDMVVHTERFDGRNISIRKACKALSLSGNMLVNLRDVYVTNNRMGIVCKSDHIADGPVLSPRGVVNGVVFYNSGDDFDADCGVEWTGPLSRSVGMNNLMIGVTIVEPLLIVGMASLPWFARALKGLWSTRCRHMVWPIWMALAMVFCTWAYLFAELSEAMKVLKHAEYRDVKTVWTICASGLCVGLLALCLGPAYLQVRRIEKRRVAARDGLLRNLEEALWDGCHEAEMSAKAELKKNGWNEDRLREKVHEMKRLQSLHAGVSVAYLLSEEFLTLVRERTGKENPTFLEMKDPFWLSEDAIGKSHICARDGRPGCALVDTLQPQYRRASTHFLSWVWGYELQHVRDALRMWTEEEGLDPRETFLYMCFFVNNQFRILVEESQAGSDDLGAVFEENLQRIGKVVALLDHWKNPRYLTRIWTIFEQFTAEKLGVPVTMILAREAAEELIAEIDQGSTGIKRIRDTLLCNVKAEEAQASVKADEERVKALITSTIGFERVNRRVQRSMVTWVAAMLRRHIDQLMANPEETRSSGDSVSRQRKTRRVSCSLAGWRVRDLAKHFQPMEVEQG